MSEVDRVRLTASTYVVTRLGELLQKNMPKRAYLEWELELLKDLGDEGVMFDGFARLHDAYNAAVHVGHPVRQHTFLGLLLFLFLGKKGR